MTGCAPVLQGGLAQVGADACRCSKGSVHPGELGQALRGLVYSWQLLHRYLGMMESASLPVPMTCNSSSGGRAA